MPPHQPDDSPTIAVVGAGFSGAILAAQLLRRHYANPCRVVLVNRSGAMARGVAYGTRSSRHVLNVPAGRMSAFPDDEGHFLRFVRAENPAATGGSFVERRIFGEYLAHTLAEAAAAAGTATLQRVTDEVVDIEPAETNALVHLRTGRPITADAVALAVGNYPPANPRLPSEEIFRSSLYIRDPWEPNVLQRVPRDAPVLLLGTGLTMLDVALELAASGRSVPMTAVSRRGLVPQPHRSQNVPPSYSHLPPSLIACEPSAVDFLRAIRQHVRILDRSGVDWREVMASLRPLTPRLWQLLDSRERERFLRHLRPFWDVHRHRVAPDLYRTFEALRTDGELRTRAARILDLRERDGLVHATLRGRGTTAEDVSAYGCVVNCTGPAGDVRTLEDPLITQLLGRGFATPDAHGLGLEVTEDLALVDRDGRASRVLSLVGPLLRGAFWEATAVPELRQHAARVATRLHAMLEGLAPNEAPTAQRARAMTSAG